MGSQLVTPHRRDAWSLLTRSFLLSLRMDGIGSTFRRGWDRFFGEEEYYLFLRNVQPPASTMKFPLEINGITVRDMTESDLDEIARLIPFELSRLPVKERRAGLLTCISENAVATRERRIVGAVWYSNEVAPERYPWYHTLERLLVQPARVTTGFFVVPGEKAAVWALAKYADERLAATGVRTIIDPIQAHNKASILVARMSGGKLVARAKVSYRLRKRTTRVEPVAV